MKIENIYIEGLNKELTFWIGTSKEDNDNMMDKASENDIWFHVNNISSCHVICKMPVAFDRKEMKYIIKTGALLCKKYKQIERDIKTRNCILPSEIYHKNKYCWLCFCT